MKVLYHLPVLPPKVPQAEALSQEIDLLCKEFNGELVFLNPNSHMPFRVPRLSFGFQMLRSLRKAEQAFDLHHIYNPEPFAYPVLRWLRRPVVYSITGSAGAKRPNIDFFNSLGAVTLLDENGLRQLQQWGIANAHLARPGIDVSRFTHRPLPLQAGNDGEFRLLMASAPWTLEQFTTKGIEALLEVATQDARIHLTLLWRGVWVEEIKRRVQQFGLAQRVEIIDGLVDVNALLAKNHAAILLAQTAHIVKAYPHSLLDSLAAGKPVLISKAIPMASYVAKTGCGVVVEALTSTAILAAVNQLKEHYQQAQSIASVVGKRDFSQSAMIESYRTIYEGVLTGRHHQ